MLHSRGEKVIAIPGPNSIVRSSSGRVRRWRATTPGGVDLPIPTPSGPDRAACPGATCAGCPLRRQTRGKDQRSDIQRHPRGTRTSARAASCSLTWVSSTLCRIAASIITGLPDCFSTSATTSAASNAATRAAMLPRHRVPAAPGGTPAPRRAPCRSAYPSSSRSPADVPAPDKPSRQSGPSGTTNCRLGQKSHCRSHPCYGAAGPGSPCPHDTHRTQPH